MHGEIKVIEKNIPWNLFWGSMLKTSLLTIMKPVYGMSMSVSCTCASHSELWYHRSSLVILLIYYRWPPCPGPASETLGAFACSVFFSRLRDRNPFRMWNLLNCATVKRDPKNHLSLSVAICGGSTWFGSYQWVAGYVWKTPFGKNCINHCHICVACACVFDLYFQWRF